MISKFKFIFSLIFILLVSIETYSQTITLTPIGTQDVSGIPVSVEHQVTTANGVTSVRIFRTHFGNGSTSQYAQYPSTRSEMDRLFNTSWSATTLWWSGNINATSSLNFYNYTTLTSAGASVPGNGDFYSTEVTFTIVAAETGTYSFALASDDGSDLSIGGTSIIEYYGGKGVGAYKYGIYNMVAGQQYNVIARMQEYGGGDGLVLVWRRPSQSSLSLQTSEIGVTSTSWVSQGTLNTNANGQATWTNANNRPYRVTINTASKFHTITDADMNYMMYMKAFPNDLQSWDYYTCDCNNSSTFNWDDINFCYTLWLNAYLHNKYIFTQSEKNTIEANPQTNYYNTYFPSQNRTIENQNQFYIMGTGKHRNQTNSNVGRIQ
jgi:hypothetical protein